MVRYMNPDETKYCKVVVRHIPIVLENILAKFSTVYRHLTASQILICLTNGAFVGEVINGKIVEITKENYNIIEVNDEEEIIAEESVDDEEVDDEILEESDKEDAEEEIETPEPVTTAAEPIKIIPVIKQEEPVPAEEEEEEIGETDEEEFERLFEEELAKEEAEKDNE